MNSKVKVYIPTEWITGEMDLFTISDPIEHRLGNMLISKMRLEMLKGLPDKGYEIVTDSKDIDENTICLVFDKNSYVGVANDPIKFKSFIDAKIEKVAEENYHFPRSMKILEYFSNPFFPAVFKNTLRNGGIDKFLISSPNQLEKIKRFFMLTIRNPKYHTEWQHIIAQELIESPSKYASYMRVLISGSGEVLGSSLKYACNMPNSFTLDGLFEEAFLRPDSPFYIGSKKMFNYYAGGENISLENSGELRDDQREVIRAHGMDPDNLKVPDEVLDVCQKIMANCNREIGVICGIDFMLNKRDGKWYYLENQAFPAIDEWAIARGIPMPTNHDIYGYVEVLKMDTQARLEVLDKLAEKRKQEEKSIGSI